MEPVMKKIMKRFLIGFALAVMAVNTASAVTCDSTCPQSPAIPNTFIGTWATGVPPARARGPALPWGGQPARRRQALAALRKELNGLVGAWSHRTGQPHGVIHNELRRTCGGPPLPQATADQIQARIDTIRRWAISGR